MQESVPGESDRVEPHHGGAQESSEEQARQDQRARQLNAGGDNADANDSGGDGGGGEAPTDGEEAPTRAGASGRSAHSHSGNHSPNHSGNHSANNGGGTATERFGRQAWAWGKELLTIIVIAVVLSFLIKTFLFRAFFIPSGSMENTLQIQDRIFVNLLVPEPFALKRGDVVVFKDSQGWLKPEPASDGPIGWVGDVATFIGLAPDNSQQHLVKRVIGLPGDRVMCCSADGKLTVNGQPITEPYLYPGAAPSDTPFDVTVPEGHLWVMGDHRNNSQDSRYHNVANHTGFVPVDDVEGRAVVVAWPVTHWGILGNYPDVFTDVPAPASSSVGSQQHVPAGQ